MTLAGRACTRYCTSWPRFTGSVNDAANYLGINAIYLQRLANDSKTSPSEDVRKKLGLQRIVSYVRGNMTLLERRRVRVRPAGVATTVSLGVGVIATKALPAEVPEQKSDKVLIALHYRPGMVTSDLAVMLATMPSTLLPTLRVMALKGTIESAPASPTRGASLLWKLTHEGAKAAVFALHRERKHRPKSTFVGGLNPWTGAKVRK